jgi:hypothetical protein
LFLPDIPDLYKYLLIAEQLGHVNNQLLQFPGPIGYDKVFRMSDLASQGMNAISSHVKNTLQMQISSRLIVLF